MRIPAEVMIDRDSLIKETIDKYLSEGTIDEYLSEVMIDNYLSETMKDKGLLIEPGSIVTPMDIKFQDFDLESSE